MLGYAARFIALALAAAFAALPTFAADPAQIVQADRTLTGIPIDKAWKQKVYAFAREQLNHPAWGWTHSERDYLLASSIARREGMKVDDDVLFAASFVHDIGAIGDFQREGIDHAVRSVEIAEPFLTEAGFPVEKLPAVREAILGHMHDKPAGARPESIVLHDADTLDFLGAVGVARRLSVTGAAADMTGGLARIREFAVQLPHRLVTRTAKAMAQDRVQQMHNFLVQLEAETAGGRLP